MKLSLVLSIVMVAFFVGATSVTAKEVETIVSTEITLETLKPIVGEWRNKENADSKLIII